MMTGEPRIARLALGLRQPKQLVPGLDLATKLRVFQRDAYISIDFAEQQVEAYRLDRAGARPAIGGGNLPIEKEEPLRREIEDFLRAVREKSAPRVSGEDGRAALALADRIASAMVAVA